MVRQQASLNRALQFDSFSPHQQGLVRYIVMGLRHVRHCAANRSRATPVCVVQIDEVLSVAKVVKANKKIGIEQVVPDHLLDCSAASGRAAND
jgi:hypothetical protein